MVKTSDAHLALRFVAAGTRLFGKCTIEEADNGRNWTLEVPDADFGTALFWLLSDGLRADKVTVFDCQEWLDEKAALWAMHEAREQSAAIRPAA